MAAEGIERQRRKRGRVEGQIVYLRTMGMREVLQRVSEMLCDLVTQMLM